MSSAYPILLWWSWECVLYLIIIIKSEVWIINHCLGLGHVQWYALYGLLCSHARALMRISFYSTCHVTIFVLRHFTHKTSARADLIYWAYCQPAVHLANHPDHSGWISLVLALDWTIGSCSNNSLGFPLQPGRQKLSDEFSKQVSTVFQQWETDLEKAKEQEEKLQVSRITISNF